MIVFLLSLKRIFTNEKERSYNRELLTKPAFLLMYTPYCSFCKVLLPIWENLSSLYENDSQVIIAQIDCSLYDNICASFASSRGLPSLYTVKKGRVTVVQPERSLSSFISIVEELKRTALSIPCPQYPVDYDSSYPFFVFGSETISGKELCDNLLRIVMILPEAKNKLYYESGADNTSYVAHLRPGVTVEYVGSYAYPHMIKFTKDYLMTPFGYWRVDDGPISSRRFLFVVHGGAQILRDLLPIANERIQDVVVGGLRYEDFHASEPELALTLPAVVILDKRKARFAIVEKVETAERFAEIIDQVMGGEMDSHAKIRLPNLFPRLVDPPPEVEINFSLFGKGRWLWIVAALLVAGVIIWAISRIPDAKLD